MKYSLVVHLEVYSSVGDIFFFSLNETTNEDLEMLIIKNSNLGVRKNSVLICRNGRKNKRIIYR